MKKNYHTANKPSLILKLNGRDCPFTILNPCPINI